MIYTDFSSRIHIIYVIFACAYFYSISSTKSKGNVDTKKSKSLQDASHKKDAGFYIGKIPRGHYLDYAELNEFMYPKKAVELCEGDIECAGFAYSGAKSVGQPFYIYFYRYITPSSISMLSVTNEERVWTSYMVKRNFVVLPGKRKSNKNTIFGSNNDTPPVLDFCKNVLSTISILDNQKRISIMNKIKWTDPVISAITVEPFVNSNVNIITNTYLDTDDFTLQEFDINHTKSRWLTLLRLHPAIKDQNIETKKRFIEFDQINRCCSNLVGKEAESAPMVDNNDLTKPNKLSCHKFKPEFVQLRTPVILEKCADTCMKKTWDLGDDIVPSEQGRKWLIADKKTGRLNDTGLSWGLMHNLLSNPNQLPIDNYRRIQSTEYSRPGDLALSRILDLKGVDTVVPLIEDWNLLVKRPLNVIDRIGQHTVTGIENNARGMDSTATLISEGSQEWLLIPTNVRTEINVMLCKPLNSKECKTTSKKKKKSGITQWDFNEAWFDHISPQVSNSTWNGRRPMKVVLQAGETLFIPSSWSYAIKSRDASLLLWEYKLTEASVETFAAKVRTEKDQGMVNGLIKALEKREGERIPRMLLKRLSEALKQIRTSNIKSKKL